MKHTNHFDAFLSEVVNLNETRLTQLEDSVEAVKGVIKTSGWTGKSVSFASHGSWAHKTIIKPVEGNAFDADLIAFVQPVPDWGPRDYLTNLKAVFTSHGTYKDKVRRYSHCVTIEYAGERRIDVAPCLVNRGGLTRNEVCNFGEDGYEASEPNLYTDWLVERNSWTGSNGLRKVTRLHKYLRDIKTTFSCPSVLLTTLIGMQVSHADENDEASFSDVPTALKTLTARLDDWLQAQLSRPLVRNPVLPSELFSDLWNDTQYANFREKVATYRTWIDDAYQELNRDESIGKWRRVFGDDFAKSVVAERAASVSDSARELVARAPELIHDAAIHAASGITSTASVLGGDLVDLFTKLGKRCLPEGFDSLPHKQRPRWRRASGGRIPVRVLAGHYDSREGQKLGDLSSGDGPLPKFTWLRFTAYEQSGVGFGQEFDVHWRVTNTDKEASADACLRGNFEASDAKGARWESLKYRGVHSVEAFVVRKRDGLLVGQSEPFYVVIQ